MAKTFRNLYPQIYDFENLERAYQLARRGKRQRPPVLRFEYDRDSNLIDIQNHLIWGTWQTGQYRHFTLHEPVYRQGASLPFRDRVMHHALVAVLEPCFLPRMITHTYACIAGRGTHRGADKAQAMLRRVQRDHGRVYVLKSDISKYFYNINHDILRRILRKRIACKPTLRLLDEIIGSFAWAGERHNPRGIPLGNLTSQLFANIYLGEMDLFVKHQLRERHYARYMDDSVIVHHDKQHLHRIRKEIDVFLHDHLALQTNRKTQVFPVTPSRGRALDFLGYRIWTTHRKLRKNSITRIKRSLKRLQKAYAVGDATLEDIRPVVHSWLAHARHANSRALQRAVLGRFAFVRGGQRSDDTEMTPQHR